MPLCVNVSCGVVAMNPVRLIWVGIVISLLPVRGTSALVPLTSQV